MWKPIKLTDIPKRRRIRLPMAVTDTRDFMVSSYVAGEIRIPEGVTIQSCWQAYDIQRQRNQYPMVIKMSQGRLFMIKK